MNIAYLTFTIFCCFLMASSTAVAESDKSLLNRIKISVHRLKGLLQEWHRRHPKRRRVNGRRKKPTTIRRIQKRAAPKRVVAVAPMNRPQQPVVAGKYADNPKASDRAAAIASDKPPASNSDYIKDCLDQFNYARHHYMGNGIHDLQWSPKVAQRCVKVAQKSHETGQLQHFDIGAESEPKVFITGQILSSGKTCSSAYNGWVTNEAANNGGHFAIITGGAKYFGCATVGDSICCDFSDDK
jgi:hypothetical protein